MPASLLSVRQLGQLLLELPVTEGRVLRVLEEMGPLSSRSCRTQKLQHVCFHQ
jgi:hypothetical protein